MLSEKQLEEIREWLNKSQNPLFFFDNDADGLASFLLLRRYIGRGKGVAIKSRPDLSTAYLSKVKEFKPDVIFILDKPLVSDDFLNELALENIPVVWIDHHLTEQPKEKAKTAYYSPLDGTPSTNEPVAYWCWKITKKDDWIGMIGCIGDWFIPDFSDKYSQEFPGMLDKRKSAAQALFETQTGKIVKIVNFALKDKTSNVIQMLRKLETAKSPYEILDDKKFEQIRKRYEHIEKKYSSLLEKAKELGAKGGKYIFFQYGGPLSLSAEISNELFYIFPEKFIVVVYIKGDKANVSIRGKGARDFIEKVLKELPGTGGGHEVAVGASLSVEDLPKFYEMIKKHH